MKQFADRQQALFDEADWTLEEALRAETSLMPLLQDHEFDADSFCASAETAPVPRAQFNAGLAKEMDYAVLMRRP